MCASVRDWWSAARARTWARERAQAVARARRRLQSRALDAIALRHRHATQPSGPTGRALCGTQYTLELRIRRDRSDLESDRMSKTIEAIGERIDCRRLKTSLVPRAASRYVSSYCISPMSSAPRARMGAT